MFLLASCAPAHGVGALPQATAVSVVYSTPTESVVMPPSPTAAPTQIPCDPFAADFCITDGHFILQRPIRSTANDSVDKSYRYASTADGSREPHHGVEFLNKFGTPVYAAADGVVAFAGPDVEAIYSPRINFYGNLIVIKHDNDLFTLYAHLSAIDVQQGDGVTVGEKIGEVGQSGAATGSHLHFEVRRGNGQDYFSTQNPELWLVPEMDNNNKQYGVVTISVMDEGSRLQDAELTLERLSFARDKGKIYYLNTYVSEMAMGEENAAMSDLPAGRYRIALKLNGHLYERWVEVQSGQLTQVVIVVK